VTVICVKITYLQSKKHNKFCIQCRTQYDTEEATSNQIRRLIYTYKGRGLGNVNRCAAAEKNTEMQEKRDVNSNQEETETIYAILCMEMEKAFCDERWKRTDEVTKGDNKQS
jgi:hypothetical protein